MSSSIALLASPEILKFRKSQLGGPSSPVQETLALISDLRFDVFLLLRIRKGVTENWDYATCEPRRLR